MNSLSFAFIAVIPFESWDDCMDMVRSLEIMDLTQQCVGIDAHGNRTNYDQEPKLAPEWSLRPVARPKELEKQHGNHEY